LLRESYGLNWSEAEKEIIHNGAGTCESYQLDEYVHSYSGITTNNNSYDKYYSKNYYNVFYDKETQKECEKILKNKHVITYDNKTCKITNNKLRVLGGDDKCGISVALQVAKENISMPMKILFTTGEETGCIGIKHFCKTNSNWFKNVKYSLTVDRRYGDNLITYACGKWNCSLEFASEITKQGILSGIMVKNEIGTVADTIHIRDHVKECVNMSAGYYNPHSCDEYIQFDEMIQIKDWVSKILTNV